MDFTVVIYMIIGGIASAPIWMLLLAKGKPQPAKPLFPSRILVLDRGGAVVSILELQYDEPTI